MSGAVDGVGGSAHLPITAGAKTTRHASVQAANPHAAIEAPAALSDCPLAGDIAAFGHRIVHGAPDADRAVLVGAPNLAWIEAVSPLPCDAEPCRPIRTGVPNIRESYNVLQATILRREDAK